MQTPPPGSFDFSALLWKEKRWYGKTFARVATIPLARLPDLLIGEGDRGDTEFVKCRSGPRTGQGKSQKVLNVITYHCAYGPEHKSKELRRKPELSGGEVENQPENGGTQLEGEEGQQEDGGREHQKANPHRKPTEPKGSVKRGCMAHFDVVVYVEKPEEVEIRYHQHQHVNRAQAPCHGKGCPNAGRARYAPYLSQATKMRVRAALLKQSRPSEIIKQIRTDLAKEYQLANGLSSTEEAMTAMQVKGTVNPRDWYIKLIDIANITRSMNGSQKARKVRKLSQHGDVLSDMRSQGAEVCNKTS